MVILFSYIIFWNWEKNLYIREIETSVYKAKHPTYKLTMSYKGMNLNTSEEWEQVSSPKNTKFSSVVLDFAHERYLLYLSIPIIQKNA